jgi:hypothetical protein
MKRRGSIFSQEFGDSDVTPSWQQWGDGSRTLDVTACNLWVAFRLIERGEKSSKETHVTLPREDMIALRDLLNAAINSEEIK